MKLHSDVGNEFDLAARRLEVAREDLETAKSNLKESHFRAANNRAYYSIYHSITAVFALENRAYKRHKDTIANFNKDYVKTEIFSRELGRRIGNAEEVRHNSDYDDFYLVTKEESALQVETAELLLKEVELYIEKKHNN
jgi:uncharacterized protein (UPF0332 family)